MKKRIAWLLAACLLLSGCSVVPAQTVATVTSPAEPIAPQLSSKEQESAAYRPVSSISPESQEYHDSLSRGTETFQAFNDLMNDNMKLTNIETGATGSIQTILSAYASTTGFPTVRQMTMVDLNQDDAPELILWLQTPDSDRYAFLMLSYADQRIFGTLLHPQYFHDLKTDGTFHQGTKAWVCLADPFAQTPPIPASGEASEHEAKADVIWYSQWVDLLCPGTADTPSESAGILNENIRLTDTARGEQIRLEDAGQLLVPQGVKTRVVQWASIDLDRNGTIETILQIGTETDDYVGFVIAYYDGGRYIGQGYYYRTFHDLRVDGSYAFSSGARDCGYAMRTYVNGSWQETVLAQTYETTMADGSIHQIYFVGGDMTTKDAYDRFAREQEDKLMVTWYPSLEKAP